MTISSRTVIKSYFETGDKPTQAQFSDFIDSALFYEDTSDFGRALISASAAASARSLLGSGAVGDKMFTTITTASAQQNIGGGIVGRNIFQAITTVSAQDNMGLGTAATKDTGISNGQVPLIGTQSATTALAGLVELLTNEELAAASDTSKAATAAAIASLFGTSLISTNGYARLPVKVGGAFVEVIIQWGIVPTLAPNTTTTITFPLAFPSGNFVGFANSLTTNIAQDHGSFYDKFSNTQAKITNTDDAASDDVSWFAIGW